MVKLFNLLASFLFCISLLADTTSNDINLRNQQLVRETKAGVMSNVAKVYYGSGNPLQGQTGYQTISNNTGGNGILGKIMSFFSGLNAIVSSITNVLFALTNIIQTPSSFQNNMFPSNMTQNFPNQFGGNQFTSNGSTSLGNGTTSPGNGSLNIAPGTENNFADQYRNQGPTTYNCGGREIQSGNFNVVTPGGQPTSININVSAPRGIIVHTSEAGKGINGTINSSLNARPGGEAYCYNFGVARDGSIIVLRPDKNVNHIKGPSTSQRQSAAFVRSDLSNSNTISITLLDTDNDIGNGSHYDSSYNGGTIPPTPNQLLGFQQLVLHLLKTYPSIQAVYGHGEIQNDRHNQEGQAPAAWARTCLLNGSSNSMGPIT